MASFFQSQPSPATLERLRRIFNPTPEEREQDRLAFEAEQARERELERKNRDMGHAGALWSRLIRKYASKHARRVGGAAEQAAGRKGEKR